MYAAGSVVTVPAGHWYMMTFEEPSQVLDHGWLTLSGGVQGLYTTYRIRQERAKREEYPWLVPKTLKLRKEWRDFIEESTSRFDEDCLAPFSFNPPGLRAVQGLWA
jgi:hypothetical protein